MGRPVKAAMQRNAPPRRQLIEVAASPKLDSCLDFKLAEKTKRIRANSTSEVGAFLAFSPF